MNAQDEFVTLTGSILDIDDNVPAVGAVIYVPNTNYSAVADMDGNYTLRVPVETNEIRVQMLGYQDKVIPFDPGNLNEYRIIYLVKDIMDVEEVRVVAFATQKKESVIASIETVRPSELQVPSSDLTHALSGRIAGLISYQRSGEPGQDEADFFVRGITTFGTGKKDPLILIDGVEYTARDLARLVVDDISSFSIMKDANATALYGARGANGVILVETKEGKRGETKLSIRMESSISMPTSMVELADPIDYMIMHNEAIKTRDPLQPLFYSREKVENTIRGTNKNAYPATDWYNMLLEDYTMNERMNINLSGGGRMARYYVAASVANDNGNLKMDNRNNFNNNINLKKYVLRSNVNVDVTNTTEMIVRLHGAFDDYVGPLQGGSAIYNQVMNTNPVLFPPFYEPDEARMQSQNILFGNFDTGQYNNPYADMVKGYKNQNVSSVLAQFELKQDLAFITEGLKIRGLFSTRRFSDFDLTRQYNPHLYQLGYYDRRNDSYSLAWINEASASGHLDYQEGTKIVTSSVYGEGALNYDYTIGERNDISGLLVFTVREELHGNAGNLQTSLPYRNIGLAGRGTYSFDSRYFIEANFGYNGSERFAREERFGFFPSGGVGYLVSNESFWEPLKEKISLLKLKATYGVVGNDAIGSAADRFFYMSEVNLNDGSRSATFGREQGYSRPGVSISRYEDPYITWETAYKQNYGIEIGFFSKLELQVDYFREKRSNILQTRSYVPSTMGLQQTTRANVGIAKGHGVDASLDFNQYWNSGFWLSGRGNFTYATSVFEQFEEPTYADSPWRRRTGQKLSQRFGYIAERLFIDDLDIASSPKQYFGEYKAGDIKYKDINDDGIIDDGDMVPIGYPTTPEINYGFGLSSGYKGFDISVFFQGSARSSFWINTNAISPFIGNQRALMSVIAEDHWSEADRDPYAFYPRLSTYTVNNNSQVSTWWMRNGNFFRVKNFEFGYTVPERLSQKIAMNVARIYLSGTNLHTFSGFNLWDPEMASNGLGYPVQRVFNLGINASF